jgi:hypothetical protein
MAKLEFAKDTARILSNVAFLLVPRSEDLVILQRSAAPEYHATGAHVGFMAHAGRSRT